MNPLDRLGLAIVDAGYKWTREMRSAYEKGIRQMKKEDAQKSKAIFCCNSDCNQGRDCPLRKQR